MPIVGAMILYRYFRLNYALEALQTGRWKIGRLTELNDPLDCTPRVVSSGPFLDTQLKLEMAVELIKNISTITALLCFSETISDPVIWSHYAEAHSGIALGFDFSQEDEPPLKVYYSDIRPTLDFVDMEKLLRPNIDEEMRKRLTDKLMLAYRTKAPTWEYEQEFRAFIDLEQCFLIGSHYFRNMPVKQLRQVVLGARCTFSGTDIKRILRKGPHSGNANSDSYGNVEIKKCAPDASRFTFKIEDA
jgi:hypothetical protein